MAQFQSRYGVIPQRPERAKANFEASAAAFLFTVMEENRAAVLSASYLRLACSGWLDCGFSKTPRASLHN